MPPAQSEYWWAYYESAASETMERFFLRRPISMNQAGGARVLRSLRSRILLLALLVCALLASALTGFFLLSRQTQSAMIADSATNLLAVVNTFASDYLTAVRLRPGDGLSTLNLPPGPDADARLSAFTINALRRDAGIEGGFYSSSTDSLEGYAFPTSEGPGPKSDIPPRERPTILSVARQAVATGKAASHMFRGQQDVILFQAVPLAHNGDTFGSVWAMHRLHDANSGREVQALLGLSGLAFAATACVGIAFSITRSVQTDVSTIQRRLEDLERDLSEPRRGEASAAELQTILRGIDKLGISLQQKIAEERQLVEQLHHKERLASLGQVAAGVAHELRNPLATIRLRAQMSLRGKDADQLDRSAKLILEEIDRLNSVLDRLLYFAKPIRLQLQGFDPGQMCRELLSVLQPEAERSSITLAYEESTPGIITGDPWKLRQVVENLVRNAVESFDGIDSTPKQIVISAHATLDHVALTVQDNGAGLPPEIAARVFDPFFTTKARGTGLGLSIAKEIVRAHGGNLELKALPGRGTLAEVILPRTIDEHPGSGGIK
jgi:signal transduction histidine kinase